MGRGGPRVLSGQPIWDDDPWQPHVPLEGDVRADLCIIGLGGSGLTAAHDAMDRGATVVGLDAGPVAGAAAGRNGGFLLAGTADPHHVAVARLGQARADAIYRATLEEIDRIEVATPQAVRRTGSVRLSSSGEEDDDLAAQRRALVAGGFAVEQVELEGRRALRFPSDASMQPLRRCRDLAGSATARGARLFEHSPAVTIAADRVITPTGSVRAGATIVAVDGGLERIVPQVTGRARTARLQMLATEATDEVHIDCPVYARWGFDYWQQLPSGVVVAGGLRDAHELGEWTHDAVITDDVQRGLERLLREAIGVRRAAITHRWAGCVAFTENHLPIFEEVASRVVAIGAYSGTGNVIGALCARGATGYLLDGATSLADLFTTAAPRQHR